jgi:hypothetical protein
MADAAAATLSRYRTTSPMLQAALETAEVVRRFRESYDFKSTLAFIF